MLPKRCGGAAAQHILAEIRSGARGSGPAWLLAQRPWIVPIPGTTKLHQLEENLGAMTLDLTAEVLARIDAQAATIPVQGERLPEAALAMTGL